jgi:serine/threonine-protein kinase
MRDATPHRMQHMPYLPANSQAVTKPAHHRQRTFALDETMGAGASIGTIVTTDDHDYVLFETLGRGGMGEVRRAADLKRGRVVAIKSMHRSLARNPRLVAQFRNEGEMVASISHRNVVALFNCFDQDDRHFLVFEYLRGRTLRECIIDDAPFSRARFTAIAQQLTSALAAVHRAGIVHGDIKSGNVLLSPGFVDERVKLIDFGLAHRVQGTDGSAVTAFEIDRGISGTPGYMAPELMRGELSTYASDQYALGVVLYEMLTGVHPFARECADADVPLNADADWRAVAPSLAAPDRCIDAAFDEVLLQMLAKAPADRFASVAQLQQCAPWLG